MRDALPEEKTRYLPRLPPKKHLDQAATEQPYSAQIYVYLST